MKRMLKHLGAGMLMCLILTLAAGNSYGQIGKLKSLKAKAKKTNSDVKKTNSSVKKTANDAESTRDDAKAAAYSASPAKNELIKADRNVERLTQYFKKANWDKPDSVETARTIGNDLKMFRNNLDMIAEKDPKWNVKKKEEKYAEWYAIFDKETYDPWVRGPAAKELKIMKGVLYQMDRNVKDAKSGGEEYWFSSGNRNTFKERLDQAEEAIGAAKGKDVKKEVNYSSYDKRFANAKAVNDVEAPKGAKAGELYDYFYEKRKINVFWGDDWSVNKLQKMYYGDDYLAAATEFNPSELKTKLEEFIAAKPGEKDKENGFYQYFNAKLAGYSGAVFLNNLQESVNIDLKCANDALNSGKSWGDGLCCSANALNFCKGVLIMDPDNADFQALKASAQKTYDAVKTNYGPKIWANDYHKANVGKVKFSKTKPAFGKEGSHSWTTSFADTDNIWAMYYLPYGVNDLNKLTVKLFSGDEEIAKLKKFGESKDVKAGAAILGILPDKIPADPEANMYYWSSGLNAMSKLHTGSHKLRVEVWANVECSGMKKIADGSFTHNTATQSPGIAKIKGNLEKQMVDRVRMPKAGLKNSSMEAKIKKAFMDKGYSEVVEVKRVVILTKEWWVVKNRWGLIEERSHTAAVAYKNADGTCRFEKADFSQNYEGIGNYGSYIYWDGIYDNYEINCDNISK